MDINKYKALIVEDIVDTAQYIKKRVEKLCPEIYQIDIANTIEDAFGKIKQEKYDIVFLDIQLSSGTGFDLLRMLDDSNLINFEIIFITGESAKEYTLKAIKYSAIDFLYKPLDDEDLVFAVNKATNKIENLNYNKQVKLLLSRLSGADIKQNNIAFHLSQGTVEFVSISDILYLEADSVMTYVKLIDNQVMHVYKNLGFYKDNLVNDYGFIALSSSVIVNSQHIKRFKPRDLTMEMINGETLQISRRYGKDIKDILNEKVKSQSRFSFFRF